MNPSLRNLLFALLDTEIDPDTGEDLCSTFSIDSFTQESRDLLQRRFSRFVNRAEDAVRKLKGDSWVSIDEFYTGSGIREGSFEHAYIVTVNGSHAGFSKEGDWDGEVGAALTAICRQEEEIGIEIWRKCPMRGLARPRALNDAAESERGALDEELNIYTADIQSEEA
jgi:hypothetical protein